MQQDNLFTEQAQTDKPTGLVTCLGKTFANDAERRAYFTALLAEKLKDPEFRKIEGFPIGSDEDILNLSDPPYYTACPNPWIADFIAQWEAEKPAQPEGYHYHREPFAADVSEGKNDPIYNAHSYHTKVPHKAIMRYILHYTNPGDIVFDGFCGTGMTGVAAQMCGDREQVMSLGYQIKSDGTILKNEIDENNKEAWIEFSKLGVRKAVLNDLSPIASFIASNYNLPIDDQSFEQLAKDILIKVEEELGWTYQTKHIDGEKTGTINYTVWSDVIVCGNCNGDFVYWDAAVDKARSEVKDLFDCPHCGSSTHKSKAEKAYESYFDKAISETVRIVKQVPVMINYSIGKKRFEKKPDEFDLNVISRINEIDYLYEFPTAKIEDGAKTREPLMFGATYTHLMYTKRNLTILSSVLAKIELVEDRRLKNYLKIWFTSSQTRLHRMNRYAAQHQRHVGPLANTLYISSTPTEISPFYFLGLKIKENSLSLGNEMTSVTQVGDASKTYIQEESLDYVFIDPPFGQNIMYSDLNIIWEAWLGVKTNSIPEAIENRHQQKGIDEYRSLMTAAFTNVYKSLKPGRWLTVEFSNTKASIWNTIQTAITDSGFVVANVAALDKGRGGLHSILGTTAVKQDLVISAYKPNGGFEKRFKDEAKTEAGVWDFIRTHLQYLPVVKLQGNSLLQIPERDPRILFDQVVAYYVRKGYHLPVSSLEFQAGLAQRFVERDGMYFLDEQAAEYDKKKAVVGELVQISLFVKDEASAIQWLRQLLKLKPQVFSDINPQFMQQLSGWSKNEIQLDLRELLNQNFLCYDGKDDVPEQIHSYLSTNWKELRNLAKTDPELKAKAKDRWYVPDPNKAGDLEKLRERSLLKEFEEYKTAKKKLKVFRIEAVRAGFKKLWEAQEFASILEISTKLPNDVIAEDPILLMYYDQATMLTQNNSGGDW